VFTLPKLEIFNSTNVKNKECVHTWANNTSYASKHENWTIHLIGQSRAYIILQWLFLRSLYVGILLILNSFKFCDIEKLTILSKKLAKLVKFYIKKTKNSRRLQLEDIIKRVLGFLFMDGWFEIGMGCYCWHGVFLCFSIHKQVINCQPLYFQL